MQRLKEAAEKAKIELSSTTSTEIKLALYLGRGWRTQALGEDLDSRSV